MNNELLKIDINNVLKEFNKKNLIVLDKYAPYKQKYISANNSDYIKKVLLKKIMHRSRHWNKYERETK